MTRIEKITTIRRSLQNGMATIGSWMQIPDSSIAEIMGSSGYDWIAIDMEHGSISHHQLPNLFRAIELGGGLPLVRVANGSSENCKQALDAGAGGVIVPKINSACELAEIRKICCWPPNGQRGVGYSRANLFGKNFESYKDEAQSPILVAMIEDVGAIENLDEILQVPGLDAIFIGPYDLSASMGIPGKFESEEFLGMTTQIKNKCDQYSVPSGYHVVEPNQEMLGACIAEGYQFIAYSIDAVFLRIAAQLNLEIYS